MKKQKKKKKLNGIKSDVSHRVSVVKNPPKIGMKIYVPSSFYLSHGADDFEGGIATISKIEYSKTLPPDHCNYCFVGIKERKVSMYNYGILLSEQAELKKEYGKRKAHPDPDNHPSSNRWD